MAASRRVVLAVLAGAVTLALVLGVVVVVGLTRRAEPVAGRFGPGGTGAGSPPPPSGSPQPSGSLQPSGSPPPTGLVPTPGATGPTTTPGPTGSVRPPEPAGPIVLVPGYGGRPGAVEQLAAQLRAQGRAATVARLPGGGTGDLRVAARVLEATVVAALRGGAGSVDLVGYSAGGIVVRLWIAQYDGARRARRVVTLGAPHHGTQLAGLALQFAPDRCPAACRQLAPGSDVLAGLNDGDETPDGPGWVSVWTDRDQVVTPPETARLAGAVDVRLQGVCADAATEHGALPTDPLVVGLVLRSLAPGALRPAPSAAECAALRAAGR